MPSERLLRLPQVLERVSVSKSTWWKGVRDGIFPKQIKLTTRTSAWREREIDALCRGENWREIYPEDN
jgi:prophage regulatory protein